jgi:hypothetical protein
MASKHSGETNRAVNSNSPGSTRLYDLALRNDDRLDKLTTWLATYDDGPFSDGGKVIKYVKQCDNNFQLIDGRLIALQSELNKVDEKIDEYGCPYRLGQGPKNCEDEEN